MIIPVAFVLPLFVLLGAAWGFRNDLVRRRLSLTQPAGWNLPTFLDVASVVAVCGVAGAFLYALIDAAVFDRTLPLFSPIPCGSAVTLVILIFLSKERRRQVQFQRPAGIICAETLILGGAYLLIEALILPAAAWSRVPHGSTVLVECVAAIVIGGAIIAIVVPPFVRGYEGHRILARVTGQGESVQPEYSPPTWECPYPERWKMLDSQTTELEIIDFLKALVIAVKPQLIVETGTFLAYSTLKMAEGLKSNRFGKIVTIESDPQVFEKAKEKLDASDLGQWIEYRNASSLETKIDGLIDIFFSDSHLPIREEEIRRWLPQIDPRGLILVHDASSHYQIVRESLLCMEREGLLSVVLVSTPRGLVIAQKREGRK